MREHPLLLWWWLHYHPVDPHPHQTCALASHAHLPYPPVWSLSMIPFSHHPPVTRPVDPRINALTSFKFNGSPSPPSRYCPTNHYIHLQVIPIYMGRNCFHGSKHALSLATPKHTTLIGWSLSFRSPSPSFFLLFLELESSMVTVLLIKNLFVCHCSGYALFPSLFPRSHVFSIFAEYPV